jgi:hypothetical protein
VKVSNLLGISLVVVLGAGAAWFVASPFVFAWATGQAIKENLEVVAKVSLACGGEAKQTIERWSLTGHSIGCRRNGVEHGPWEAWDNGRLRARGEFKDGAKHGTWRAYNKDGSVFRTDRYDSGKEIPNAPGS